MLVASWSALYTVDTLPLYSSTFWENSSALR